MAEAPYDIVIIGAGSGGLTAAGFATQLGARTALIESNRIGGDCTWTGCVPSKALLKAAKVAHLTRTARSYGVNAGSPSVDMKLVSEYVRSAIEGVYQHETPESLTAAGIEVINESAQFVDSNSVKAGDRVLHSKSFLITTGARPVRPPIPGLESVPFVTYEQIFDNDRLPEKLAVIGGGPIGSELAQAYQRLGAAVTLVDRFFLPADEPEAQETMREVFSREGIRFIDEFASGVAEKDGQVVVGTDSGDSTCDMLLVATGRAPRVEGLGLDRAGVRHSVKGIPVDDRLRTNVKHIYAAGDVIGQQQFTHLAGWQAFQAVRNALLPGGVSGSADLVPWVTYTDPEVAHVGMTEKEARESLGDKVHIHTRPMSEVDRAIADQETDGFLKIVTGNDGTILGTTIVASRAGELIGEFVLAIRNKHRLKDLASAIHPYPTYSTSIQQLAAEATINHTLEGTPGKLIRGLSRLVR